MTDPYKSAQILSAVIVWQAQQVNLKPMRPHEFVKTFNASLPHITPVLEILGWTRTVLRGWNYGRRYRRVFWCPKGVSLYRAPRGRPTNLSLQYQSNPKEYSNV